jgi:CubicO group peptidase (beta-lactamase class C family)
MMWAGSFQPPRHYMRRFLLVVATAFALLGRTPRAAEDPRLERFGDYVESLRLQTGIPGLAVAIVGNNAVLWQRAFGRQDIERSIAARTDTPFQLDGLTQVFTATMVLRCVEEGTLSLSDPVGNLISPTYRPRPAEPNATVGQLLTHTSGTPANLVFAYRPERLEPLVPVVRTCAVSSFRKTLSNMFEQLAMVDSVPGPDIISLVGPVEGYPTPEASVRYAAVLQRLATPYAVDQNRRAVVSPYATTVLTPAAGVISTVQDLAEFVLALRRGILLKPDTLASAWQAPLGPDGERLPHGDGWFVQSYNGETVVWQYGIGEKIENRGDSSSSLMVMLPSRGLTLIILANSSGLAKSLSLSAGDVSVSAFARVFLGLFAK